MSKTYYIDSENVGESWINFLDSFEDDSKAFVFYTVHSPRIHYDNVLKLLNAERKPEFIRCHEGSNALDFQLVSYLGYQLRSNESEEVVIVTNDTGFDAVVNFWLERNINISRLPLKNNAFDIEDIVLPVSTEEVAKPSVVASSKTICNVDVTELYTVVNCVGKKNLTNLSLACTHFYGNKKGLEIYKQIKSESFTVPATQWLNETKMKKFCELIFKYCNDSGVSVPADLFTYLYSKVGANDDKNAMKKKLENHYDVNVATALNKILKPFYETLKKIKY